ncbi:hypothetical protein KBB68_04145 [Candidatus Babeliales bacterium]|nr:hypothetical protein [Candidatus Babeliales bacterium]
MLSRQKLLIYIFLTISPFIVAEIPEFSNYPEFEVGPDRNDIAERNRARNEAENRENERLEKFKKSSFWDKVKSLKSGDVSFKEAWHGKPDDDKIDVARKKAAFGATRDEVRDNIFKSKPKESVDALLEMHMTPKEIEYQKDLADREVRMTKSEKVRQAKLKEIQKAKEVNDLVEKEKQAVTLEVQNYKGLMKLDNDGMLNKEMINEYNVEFDTYEMTYKKLAEKLKNEFLNTKNNKNIEEFTEQLQTMKHQITVELSKKIDSILSKHSGDVK